MNVPRITTPLPGPRARALIARDAAIVLGVTVLALALAAATLRRRTP